MEVDNKVLDILLQFCCLDFLYEEPRRGCLAKRGHTNLPHKNKDQPSKQSTLADVSLTSVQRQFNVELTLD